MSERKFMAGDEVRVVDAVEDRRESPSFPTGMDVFLGKTFRVAEELTDCEGKLCYRLKEELGQNADKRVCTRDGCFVESYIFLWKWLVPAVQEEEADADISESDFLKLFR